MKTLAKVGSLALVAALVGGITAGCSSNDLAKQGAPSKAEGATGSIGLSLQPVAGITLNTIHYVVTQTGSTTPVREGDLPTPGNAKTFNFGLPLPVGTGYKISLSGVAAESATTTCVGSSDLFNVTANTTVSLGLVLTCTDAANGTVNAGVSVTTDSCPRLIVDYVVVTPNTANVPGGTISVAGSARDLDNKPVTYSWKVANAAVGSFAPANAAASTFTCLGAGANVDVSITADNGECKKVLSTSVSCVSLTCGNGVQDQGEACDSSIPAGQPGAGPCLANCKLPTCGNGIVESPLETCDPVPADLNNCTAACLVRPKLCGDGFLEAGEPCDGTKFPAGTPAGTVCKADCTIDQPALCGNNVKESGEVCDPKFTVNDCGADCKTITSAACFTCENSAATCADFVDCGTAVGNAAAGSPAAGTSKSLLCNETLDCVRDSACASGGNAPIKCYCGTANAADCQAGIGNGACKAQLEKSLETTAFATIAQRIGNTAFGGGIAMARIDCDQTFCSAQCF